MWMPVLNALHALRKLQKPNYWKDIPMSPESEESLAHI